MTASPLRASVSALVKQPRSMIRMSRAGIIVMATVASLFGGLAVAQTAAQTVAQDDTQKDTPAEPDASGAPQAAASKRRPDGQYPVSAIERRVTFSVNCVEQ